MNASTQYKLTAADLEMVLALARAGTLAQAGERLGVDASTVFRSLQRLERGMGQRLFDRSRTGYTPLEPAQLLAEGAEQVESALEAARSALQQRPDQVQGIVRLTMTDTVLHGLVALQLKALETLHPLLQYELHTGNDLASLTRRDADIAVRATRKPPQHLVGKHIGPIRSALFVAKSAARKGPVTRFEDLESANASWIAPDDALPEHPSVIWRKRHFPKAVPRLRVNSILTVMELVAMGLGVGVLPLFMTRGRRDLLALTAPLEECQAELWLLTHPQSRHLRRVSAVYGHLASSLSLDD